MSRRDLGQSVALWFLDYKEESLNEQVPCWGFGDIWIKPWAATFLHLWI